MAVMAAALIGCAGSSGGTSASGGGGGGGARGVRVNLPGNPDAAPGYQGAGVLDVAFLTGQGREVGDLVAVIRRIYYTDQEGREERNLLSPERFLLLKGFQNQIVHTNVAPVEANSRLFPNYTLDIQEIQRDNGSNNPDVFGSVVNLPMSFPARIRVFPGRYSSLPIFLDDSMITIENNGNGEEAVFNEDQFRAVNMPNGSQELLSFISDYVSFDISAMADADKPRMSNGDVAGRVYITGDNYAVSQPGTRGTFEVLTTDASAPIEGNFAPPGSLGGVATPGTYSLLTPDPTDLSGIARVTSLQGIWREYTSVLSDIGSFEFITFPNSNDNERQELIMFSRNGDGMITAMYFGTVDLSAKTFEAFPVRILASGIVEPGDEPFVLNGRVDNLLTAGGVPSVLPSYVREGTFTIESGTAPAGFPNTGRFIVFRK